MPPTKKRTGDLPGYEVRSIGQVPEVRDGEEGSVPHLIGHAAVFNTEAVIGGLFREKFTPGAFTKTLQEFDQYALYNHEPGQILGRTSNGSLTLAEDKEGVVVDLQVPSTTLGSDTLTNVRSGLVGGQSIGFQVVKEQWDERDEMPLRTITEVKLREVSITPHPAYKTTSISEARSIMDAHTTAANATITPKPDTESTPDTQEPESGGHSEAETWRAATNQRALQMALAENEA